MLFFTAIRTMLVAILAMACAVAVSPVVAVELGKLQKYWTPEPQKIPYRAIETPGRRNAELLPLIVFLHGSGQNGSDNESQLGGYGNGSLELVDAALDAGIPLVFAAPQVDEDSWPAERIATVVRDAVKRFPINPRRIIVTGLSDGGTGVWSVLKAYPRCFAAGVPMSGMTELAGLASIRDVPQWIFHGEKDNDTDIETGYGGAMVGSRAVVRALRAMGGKPRYTEYPNEMHVIWHRAYGDDDLLPWMLDRRLRGKPCDFNVHAREAVND
jgi:predicted peptidase